MSWTDAEKQTESIFLRWDEGPFELRFVGEPEIETKHFVQGRPVSCDGAQCAHCADKVELSKSFVFDVVSFPAGDPKKLSLSKSGMKELLLARASIGEQKFSSMLIRASRSGAGKAIRYRFDAMGPAEGAGDDLPF